MHIPNGTTAELELVTFRQALAAANTPSEEYDINEWLYAPNFYSEYRYILGTRGKKPLICIGINPSTAEPGNLDNTLKSVERIWSGNVTSTSIGRIWRHSVTFFLCPRKARCGRHGVRLSRSGIT